MAAGRRNARRRQQMQPVERLRAAGAVIQSGLTRLVTAAAVFALAAVVYLAVDALRALPVERIVVTGKLEHLKQAALREALSGEMEGGLLFLDLGSLQQKLEALPWVYRAQLRRRFPDTLEVGVVEQLPIARWGSDGFLNHEARIIEVADDQRWQDLPVIRGPAGSEARLMNHYQRLLERLRPAALTPVALLEDDYGQLSVRFDSGLELQLGDRDFTLRLQRFMTLWRTELAIADRGVQRVDMRYDGGAAVAFEQPAQLAGLIDNGKGG